MGLDILAGDYGFRAGSYGGFHSFRNWCARQLGYQSIEDYYQQMTAKYGNDWNNDNGYSAKSNFMPLGYLLNHSDCDGKIPYYGAQKTLRDLVELKARIKDHNENHEETLDHWITACERSVELKEPIYFG